jgi:ribosomal protein S8E
MKLTYHERYTKDEQNGKHNAQWRYRKDNSYARAMLRDFPEFRSIARINRIVESARLYGDNAKAQAWLAAFETFNSKVK